MADENDGAEPKETPVTAEMAERRKLGQEFEAAVFDAVRQGDANPVEPVRLKPEDRFRFRCHRGVSCWNVCCHGADVTLTPFDILTLSGHFGVRPARFVEDFTVPAIHEGSGLPVAKLVMTGKDGKGACVFMDDDKGCTVYPSRPATCRYYPLGLGAVKMKGHEAREEIYFLVREDHRKGHAENKEQSVAAFREEQGVEPYRPLDERWIEILMKMASWRSIGGPMGRDVSLETKKMFYMVSTDVDALRRFVFETKFLATYEIDADLVESVRVNEVALLQLGFGWLANVMFNEPTIAMRQDVLQGAIGAAREKMGAT